MVWNVIWQGQNATQSPGTQEDSTQATFTYHCLQFQSQNREVMTTWDSPYLRTPGP